jgi:autotransporter-associated beta strand protein
MILTWLRRTTRRKPLAVRGKSRTPKQHQQPVRPRLEHLEDRLAPASHTWSGGAGLLNPNWSNAANWSAGGAPQANETNVALTFPVFANRGSRNDVAGLQISQITFQSGGYTISGNPLTLSSGATITANAGSNTINADVQLGATGINTVTVGTGATLAIGGSSAGVISGPAELDKSGAGSLLLNQANTFTGFMDVLQGVVNISNGSALGSTSQRTVVFSGAALEVQGGITVPEVINLRGGGPTGGGALRNVFGANTLTGTIVLEDAAVSIGVDAGTLTASGPVSSVGISTFGFTKTGVSTLALAGNDLGLNGPVVVSQGTLTIRNATALGTTTAGTTVNNGATLALDGGFVVSQESLTFSGTGANAFWENISGNDVWTGPVSLGTDVTVLADAGQLQINGVISGGVASDLSKRGPGQLVLTAANTYSGGTTVAEGVLTIRNGLALGSTVGLTQVIPIGSSQAALELDGGIQVGQESLRLNGDGINGTGALRSLSGNNSWAGPVFLASSTTIGVTVLNQLTLSGVISGNAGADLTKVDNGTLELAGTAANTYPGTTRVNAGNLNLNKSPGITAIPATLIIGDGQGGGFDGMTLKASNQIADTAPVFLNSTGALDLGTFAVQDTIGPLTMTGGTIAASNGRLILNGDVTVNQATTPGPNGLNSIAAGLDLGAASRTFTVNAGGYLQLQGIVTGQVAGTGLTKAGPGTLELQGISQFSGPTIVNAGLYLVTGAQRNTVTTVNNGGTLGGLDFAAGARVWSPVIANAGGTVSPGNAGPGIVTTDQSFQMNSGSILALDLDGTTPGTGYDQIQIVGNNPTVTLNNPTFVVHVGFSSAVGDTFKVLDNTTTGPTTLNLTSSTITGDNGQHFSVSLVGNDIVLTTIDTPPKFVNRSVTSPISEGGIATLTGTIVEPDPLDTFFLDVDWGDGAPVEHHSFAPGTPRDVNLTHQYLDEAPTGTPSGGYPIHLVWHDQHGLGNSGDLVATVNNVPPTVHAGGDRTIHLGSTFASDGFFTDPGVLDTWTATVDYGDGTGAQPLQLNPAGRFHLQYRYKKTGTFTVTVTVVDDDGGVGTDSFQVTVVP